MRQLTVLKIGGELIQEPEKLSAVLTHFTALQDAKILVHGGGRDATALSEQMGVIPQMIDGRRVTDATQLEIATMVYAGKVNTQLVAQLSAYGEKALGINGSDLGIIQCNKRPVLPVDFGYVGDIAMVNGSTLDELISLGICPVFSAITSDLKGQLLNTNADTVATAIAKAILSDFSVRLVYVMGIPGILADITNPSTLIPKLSFDQYLNLKASGRLSGGILPKLSNAFEALKAGVSEVIIANETTLISGKYTELCL
jgi:acetylglutamate kinase